MNEKNSSDDNSTDGNKDVFQQTFQSSYLETDKEFTRLRFRQVLAAAGPFFSTLAVGMTSGFSATLLPQLMKNETSLSIEVTGSQASWIASLAVLPMAVGCILSGYLMERHGRRLTQMVSNILFAIGWAIIALANGLALLCLGRVVTGLCVGLFSPLCLVYVAEISDPWIRGTTLATIPLAISTGVLLSHLLGTFFPWRVAASICALFPLVGFAFICSAPESPTWLAKNGLRKEAERSFRYLRGFSKNSTEELKSLLEKGNSSDEKLKLDKETLKKITSPTFLRPLLVMIVFFTIQQFSGVNAVIFYSVSILSGVAKGVNEYLSTIIIDVVRVFMSCVTCGLLRRFRRRTMAIFSSVATGLSLVVLSLSFRIVPDDYSWIALPIVVIYVASMNTGIVPLPWILTGEIFPTSLREVGSGICTCVGFIMFFTVVKISPFLFATLGTGNTFLVFAVVALLGSVFIYNFLPETKNKTLQCIENRLQNNETDCR